MAEAVTSVFGDTTPGDPLRANYTAGACRAICPRIVIENPHFSRSYVNKAVGASLVFDQALDFELIFDRKQWISVPDSLILSFDILPWKRVIFDQNNGFSTYAP